MADNEVLLPLHSAQHKLIQLCDTSLKTLCQRNFITKLSLFGSALREDFTQESDIDLLVEFEANHTPTLLKLARMERELATLFGDRKIDLRTPEELSPYFRDKVISEAVVLYDSAR
ncbi:MAG: nucleotidyltransferase family protein [Elainellaceae cyanobacterium]